MFSLIQMLGKSLAPIDIVDVGALWLGPDHVPYRELLKPGIARVIGFEPVQSECDRLNAMKLPGQAYLPYFIGDGSERTFVLTRASMCSSLYEPDIRLVSRFNNLMEVMEPVERTKVKTRKLDDLSEITGIDFLKVDVQGGEVDVLRGASKRLASTLVVHSEVNFVPQYVGCPLFGAVDAELRQHGFEFHTFPSLSGRAYRPIIVGKDANAPVKQVLWGDGVWVKSFMKFNELEPDQLLKIAVIMHEVYGSVDLAALALQHHDAKTKAGLWSVYMTRLTGATKHQPPPPID